MSSTTRCAATAWVGAARVGASGAIRTSASIVDQLGRDRRDQAGRHHPGGRQGLGLLQQRDGDDVVAAEDEVGQRRHERRPQRLAAP